MKSDTKRQNFNVTPEQEAEIDRLREDLGSSSAKDAILTAIRLTSVLIRERRAGYTLHIQDSSGKSERLLVPDLELLAPSKWRYLVARDDKSYKQLYLKGRRVRASTLYDSMRGDELTHGEAAANWDLPLEAIDEVVAYCEANHELIDRENDEDRRQAIEAGILRAP